VTVGVGRACLVAVAVAVAPARFDASRSDDAHVHHRPRTPTAGTFATQVGRACTEWIMRSRSRPLREVCQSPAPPACNSSR